MTVTPQSFQPAHIPEWPRCVSRGHLQLNSEVPLSSLVSHLCHSPPSPILSLLLSAIYPLFGQEQGSPWMVSSLTSDSSQNAALWGMSSAWVTVTINTDWMTYTTGIISSSSGGCKKVRDEGAGRFIVLWASASWLEDGQLLTVSSHGGKRDF